MFTGKIYKAMPQVMNMYFYTSTNFLKKDRVEVSMGKTFEFVRYVLDSNLVTQAFEVIHNNKTYFIRPNEYDYNKQFFEVSDKPKKTTPTKTTSTNQEKSGSLLSRLKIEIILMLGLFLATLSWIFSWFWLGIAFAASTIASAIAKGFLAASKRNPLLWIPLILLLIGLIRNLKK
jgi:hypothetical protein